MAIAREHNCIRHSTITRKQKSGETQKLKRKRTGAKQEKSKRENLDFALSIKSAIEKQIPRKPKVSFQLGFYWCPDCECAIKMKIEKSKKNISYCPFCGQALDWGEEE